MEEMYLADLENSTELVLDAKQRTRAPGAPRPRSRMPRRGSAGRATAGMLRFGNTIGAAMTGHRVLGHVEAYVMATAGAVFLILAIVTLVFPGFVAWPVTIFGFWFAAAAFAKAFRLCRSPASARTLRKP
jgi:cardiolipin synthase